MTFRDMICARRSPLPAYIVMGGLMVMITAFLERFHCAARGLSSAESSSRTSCSNFQLARALQKLERTGKDYDGFPFA